MFIPEIKNESKGIYFFGKDNLLPNNLLKWVLNSGTAKRAVTKRAAYISANGFQDEQSATFEVSPNKTANKLLFEIAVYQTYFKGFTLHIKRNLASEIAEVKVYPLQDVRKRLDGKFSYNPTYSALKFDADKEQIIESFKGARTLSETELVSVMKNGEMIYGYHKSADNPQYGIPDYYAGIEDIWTSSELQKLDNESVVNAFMPSAILTTFGDLDNVHKDESGYTEKEAFDEGLEAFTGNVKDQNGRSGRMRLMVMNVRTKEEAPILQSFDAKSIVDAANAKRDIIDRAVCRLFGVPPVLNGFQDASILGNQQALANASLELSNDVKSDQELIQEVFSMIYPGMDWTITTFKPINYIPDALLDVLTANEKRALLGYAEIVTP